jgi:hypothetical protein
MKKSKSPYSGFRFPAVVISCAVRWSYRFNLSLRDTEKLLARAWRDGGAFGCDIQRGVDGRRGFGSMANVPRRGSD